MTECAITGWIGALIDGCTLAVAIWGVRVARSGISDWHAEHKGKAAFEAVLALLTALESMREALDRARQTFTSMGELADAAQKACQETGKSAPLSYDEEQKGYLAWQYRYRAFDAAFHRVRDRAFLVGVLCDADITKAMNQLAELSRNLFNFGTTLFDPSLGASGASPERFRALNFMSSDDSSRAEFRATTIFQKSVEQIRGKLQPLIHQRSLKVPRQG
ncbi:MAG: hypothetical protein IT439_04985 [Phycisphaerales bacterium]|nr:hypothetical protein [Phycisphaerales bacterium]